MGRLDAQMWLLTGGQDPPRLIRPYLEREQSPRVRAASCGAIGAVCTQRALLDISTLLTALLIQCRPASSHWPFFFHSVFKRCSYTWIILAKWLLKCLLLFLGFVLSLNSVAASLSWLSQAGAHMAAAATQRTASTLRLARGAKDGRLEWECDHQQEVVSLPRKCNATTCSAVNRGERFTRCSTTDRVAQTRPGSSGAAADPDASPGCL